MKKVEKSAELRETLLKEEKEFILCNLQRMYDIIENDDIEELSLKGLRTIRLKIKEDIEWFDKQIELTYKETIEDYTGFKIQ
jgi:hypothetical protein